MSVQLWTSGSDGDFVAGGSVGDLAVQYVEAVIIVKVVTAV